MEEGNPAGGRGRMAVAHEPWGGVDVEVEDEGGDVEGEGGN